MITAVDTSVLLDVFGADPTFGKASRESLRICVSQGGLIACDVVWGEVSAVFPSTTAAQKALQLLRIEFSPLNEKCALAAGEVWRSYRRRGGKRDRVIADFLIGAHARFLAQRLLTRDRGFYRTYFKDLAILDPSDKR